MKRSEWLKEAKLDFVDGYESHMWFTLFRWAGMSARLYWTSLAEMVYNHSFVLGGYDQRLDKKVWELLFLGEDIG